MREMRRKDRQVTDLSKIELCLKESTCLHVGFYDEGEIYIVPVNFGYVMESDSFTLYFHGAKKGRKADLAAAKPSVGFEMETHTQLVTAEKACDFSQLYLSIVGNGVVSLLEDPAEKKAGLLAIMKKETGKTDWEFPEAMLNATAVFKLEVTGYSCKEH